MPRIIHFHLLSGGVPGRVSCIAATSSKIITFMCPAFGTNLLYCYLSDISESKVFIEVNPEETKEPEYQNRHYFHTFDIV